MMSIKKNRVLRNLLIDAVCLGVALVVFALFHHVLPRQQQSVGIVIPNPYKTETNAGTDSSLALPEGYIKGTVGAGDAFCSGVLYGAWRGMDLAEAIELGTAAAACSRKSRNQTSPAWTLPETLSFSWSTFH